MYVHCIHILIGCLHIHFVGYNEIYTKIFENPGIAEIRRKIANREVAYCYNYKYTFASQIEIGGLAIYLPFPDLAVRKW